MATLIVGGLLALVLFFAAKKSYKDLKSGKCAGCSGCSDKSKKSDCQVTEFQDLTKK